MRGTPAGQLRHRITIVRAKVYDESVPIVRDALGTPVPGQGYLSRCWAKIEPLNARETLLAASTSMSITHKITIRYAKKLANLPSGTVIEFEGRTFHISSIIDPENAHVELVILCTEQRA